MGSYSEEAKLLLYVNMTVRPSIDLRYFRLLSQKYYQWFSFYYLIIIAPCLLGEGDWGQENFSKKQNKFGQAI